MTCRQMTVEQQELIHAQVLAFVAGLERRVQEMEGSPLSPAAQWRTAADAELEARGLTRRVLQPVAARRTR